MSTLAYHAAQLRLNRQYPTARYGESGLGIGTIEWVLVGLMVLMTVPLALIAEDLNGITIAVVALFLAGTALTLVSVYYALNQNALGKAILAAGMFLYFYLELLQSALDTPAFPPDGLMPYGGPQYRVPDLQLCLIYIAVFASCLMMGYSRRLSPRLLALPYLGRRDRTGVGADVLCATLALCAYVPLIAQTGGSWDGFLQEVLTSRGGRGFAIERDLGWQKWVGLFGVFGCAAVFSRMVIQQTTRRWVLLIAGLAALIPLGYFGSRHVLLYVVLPPITLLLSYRAKGSLKLRSYVKFVLIGVSFFVLSVIQIQVRQVGWNALGELDLQRALVTRHFQQFDALVFAVHIVPDQIPYFNELMEPHFFYYAVPRILWPEKPEPVSWKVYNDLYVGRNIRTNVTPSIIGQYHLNWGLAGVVVFGLMLGAFSRLLDEIMPYFVLKRQVYAATAFAGLYAFVGATFRYYHPYYLAYCVFGLAGLWLLSYRRRIEMRN